MKVAFIRKREDAKRSEESIGCNSHNYFSHTGVRHVGQQLSRAAAEQIHAQKHCGILKSWENTLGMPGNHFSPAWGWADITTSGRHCLPPQCSPSHHLPWQLCSTSSPLPTVPANPIFLPGAAFWAPTPSPPSSSAKSAHTAPNTLPI